MADTIEFYLVEEGIKQNRHTIRLQEAVGRMIWNCAHAELTYVQEIQSYQKELPKEIGGRDLLNFFQSALSGNTDRLAEIHRNIYDQLMAKNGSYQKLLQHTRQEDGTRLKEIEEEFMSYNRRRGDLEDAITKRKQSVDYMNTLLIELEGKLSKRSRITDGRKSARGASKLESMNTQISHLRERIETTSVACVEDEAKLKSLINSKKSVLQMMFLELKELDKGRYTVIHEVISQFTNHIIPRYDLGRHEGIDSPKNLHAIDILEIHNQNWKQTEERARLKKAGLGKGVDMFLVSSPSVQLQNLHLHVTEEGTNTWKRQTVPSHPSTPQGRQDPPQKNKSTCSACSTTACSSSYDAVLTKSPRIMKFPSPLVTEYSEDDIETIELPEESSCRLPNPFPIKEFCVYGVETSKKYSCRSDDRKSLTACSDDDSNGNSNENPLATHTYS